MLKVCSVPPGVVQPSEATLDAIYQRFADLNGQQLGYSGRGSGARVHGLWRPVGTQSSDPVPFSSFFRLPFLEGPLNTVTRDSM